MLIRVILSILIDYEEVEYICQFYLEFNSKSKTGKYYSILLSGAKFTVHIPATNYSKALNSCSQYTPLYSLS